MRGLEEITNEHYILHKKLQIIIDSTDDGSGTLAKALQIIDGKPINSIDSLLRSFGSVEGHAIGSFVAAIGEDVGVKTIEFSPFGNLGNLSIIIVVILIVLVGIGCFLKLYFKINFPCCNGCSGGSGDSGRNHQIANVDLKRMVQAQLENMLAV